MKLAHPLSAAVRTVLLAALFAVIVLTLQSSSAQAAQSPGQVSEYAQPITGSPGSIVTGSDGKLWFAASSATFKCLSRVDDLATPSETTDFCNPQNGLTGNPQGLTNGPDGAIWFVENRFPAAGPRLGRVEVTGEHVGQFSYFELDFAVRQPIGGFAFASSGSRLWLTNGAVYEADGSTLDFTRTSRIGWLDHTQLQAVEPGDDHATENAALISWSDPADISTMDNPCRGGFGDMAYPKGIVAGPDGAMWFLQESDGTGFLCEEPIVFHPTNISGLGRIADDLSITEHHYEPGVREVFEGNAKPSSLTLGPDGKLWFAERNGGQIGSMSPDGTDATEHALPDLGNRSPGGIISGPDGRLWFIATGASPSYGKMTPTWIGQSTTAGAVTWTTDAAGLFAHPVALTVGPDGNIWFTAVNRQEGDGAVFDPRLGCVKVATDCATGPDDPGSGDPGSGDPGSPAAPGGLPALIPGPTPGAAPAAEPVRPQLLTCKLKKVKTKKKAKKSKKAKKAKKQWVCRGKLVKQNYKLKKSKKLKPKKATFKGKKTSLRGTALVTKKKISVLIPRKVAKGSYTLKVGRKKTKLKVS